jgi:hypothetical protein
VHLIDCIITIIHSDRWFRPKWVPNGCLVCQSRCRAKWPDTGGISRLGDLPEYDPNVAAVLARVRLWRAAPAAIQQDACRRYARPVTRLWPTTPASTLMHGAVCPRASERKSGGILFRGRWATPLLLAAGMNRRVASGAATITGMSCHRH